MSEQMDNPDPKPPRRRWWPWVAALCLLGTAGYWIVPRLTGPDSSKKGADPAARAVPVVAATARTGDLNMYLTGLGTATALNTVTLRTRVDGQLVKVAFIEGQMVHE